MKYNEIKTIIENSNLTSEERLSLIHILSESNSNKEENLTTLFDKSISIGMKNREFQDIQD